jgi:DNA-binding response OmpR family regulator
LARILLVEDNEMLVAMFQRALEREGYDVTVAVSGVEMMKVVYSSRPDLIVLDVGLPDADGRDLLAALKKDPRTRHVPVIIWSGRDTDSERRIALDLGAADYVQKGPPSTLVPKIEAILRRIPESELAKARESIAPQ